VFQPLYITLIKNHFQILKEKRRLSQTLLGAKANLNLILVHFSIEKKEIYFLRAITRLITLL
jgi:hypothetical protein